LINFSRSVVSVQCQAGAVGKSGVALRLPPHSTTRSELRTALEVGDGDLEFGDLYRWEFDSCPQPARDFFVIFFLLHRLASLFPVCSLRFARTGHDVLIRGALEESQRRAGAGDFAQIRCVPARCRISNENLLRFPKRPVNLAEFGEIES